MIQEKTKNNLTKDESELLENVLRELRLVYVKESGKESSTEKNADSKKS